MVIKETQVFALMKSLILINNDRWDTFINDWWDTLCLSEISWCQSLITTHRYRVWGVSRVYFTHTTHRYRVWDVSRVYFTHNHTVTGCGMWVEFISLWPHIVRGCGMWVEFIPLLFHTGTGCGMWVEFISLIITHRYRVWDVSRVYFTHNHT